MFTVKLETNRKISDEERSRIETGFLRVLEKLVTEGMSFNDAYIHAEMSMFWQGAPIGCYYSVKLADDSSNPTA
jgi:hypothetical protein